MGDVDIPLIDTLPTEADLEISIYAIPPEANQNSLPRLSRLENTVKNHINSIKSAKDKLDYALTTAPDRDLRKKINRCLFAICSVFIIAGMIVFTQWQYRPIYGLLLLASLYAIWTCVEIWTCSKLRRCVSKLAEEIGSMSDENDAKHWQTLILALFLAFYLLLLGIFCCTAYVGFVKTVPEIGWTIPLWLERIL